MNNFKDLTDFVSTIILNRLSQVVKDFAVGCLMTTGMTCLTDQMYLNDNYHWWSTFLGFISLATGKLAVYPKCEQVHGCTLPTFPVHIHPYSSDSLDVNPVVWFFMAIFTTISQKPGTYNPALECTGYLAWGHGVSAYLQSTPRAEGGKWKIRRGHGFSMIFHLVSSSHPRYSRN